KPLALKILNERISKAYIDEDSTTASQDEFNAKIKPNGDYSIGELTDLLGQLGITPPCDKDKANTTNKPDKEKTPCVNLRDENGFKTLSTAGTASPEV